MNNADNIIIDGVRYAGLRVDFQENFRRSLLHGKRYVQVQEHAADDERAQTQASFAESSIEQRIY